MGGGRLAYSDTAVALDVIAFAVPHRVGRTDTVKMTFSHLSPRAPEVREANACAQDILLLASEKEESVRPFEVRWDSASSAARIGPCICMCLQATLS